MNECGRTALISARLDGKEEIVAEFTRSDAGALYRGDRPGDLDGAEVSLAPAEAAGAAEGAGQGCGALAIDAGTGEIKLIAFVQLGTAQMYEVVEVKMKDIAPTADTGSVAIGGAGDTFDESKMTPGFLKLTQAPRDSYRPT